MRNSNNSNGGFPTTSKLKLFELSYFYVVNSMSTDITGILSTRMSLLNIFDEVDQANTCSKTISFSSRCRSEQSLITSANNVNTGGACPTDKTQ